MIPTPDSVESKIIMQGIHVELTPAMRTAITERFAAIMERNGHIIRVHVRLQRDQTVGHEHHFKATAQAEIGGPDLVASAAGMDAYRVIDAIADILDRQVSERHVRSKEKRNHPHGVELDAAIPKAE